MRTADLGAPNLGLSEDGPFSEIKKIIIAGHAHETAVLIDATLS